MHDFTLNMRGRYDDLRRLADHPQPRQASTLEVYIVNRLEKAPTGSPWLDRLSLHVVVPTCEMLGTLILFGSATRFKGMSDRDLHCAGDAGFEIAKDGEPAIRTALSEIAKAFVRSPYGRQGPAAIFGAFYLLLSLHHRDQAFEPVCDIVRRHVIETMPFGPGDRVLGRPVDVRFIHSVKTASRDTGRNPRRLRKLLTQVGFIGADHTRLSHDAVTFDARTTKAWLEADADSLMLPDVAAYLNVSRFQVGQFADRGFLQPLVAYREKHNHRRRIYAREAINAFLTRLTNRAVLIKAPGETQLPVILAAQRAGCDAAFLVGLILNGQLDWVGHHIAETGMPSILVDLHEVRARVESNPDDLSLRKVRIRMKTNRAIVRALLREGYLDARIAPLTANRNPVRLIERSSLDSFQADYVSVPELARTHGKSHHSVRQALNGIAPAIAKERVGLEFYRRADLPSF